MSWWEGKSREELEHEASIRAKIAENKSLARIVPGLIRSQKEDLKSRQNGGRRRAAQFIAHERRA